MEQAEPNLKVTDKRHFTAEGELRSGATSEAHEPAARAAAPDPEPSQAPSFPPVAFSSFIVSLAAQAAELIGGESKDLDGARQVISVIEMLKDKTEGRRTPEESRVIDAVLFDLRLAYVGSARGVKS